MDSLAIKVRISSGALTFGLAAGCGVVSTPYWYAQDMLSTGAGTLVPFGSGLGAQWVREKATP